MSEVPSGTVEINMQSCHMLPRRFQNAVSPSEMLCWERAAHLSLAEKTNVASMLSKTLSSFSDLLLTYPLQKITFMLQEWHTDEYRF